MDFCDFGLHKNSLKNGMVSFDLCFLTDLRSGDFEVDCCEFEVDFGSF